MPAKYRMLKDAVLTTDSRSLLVEHLKQKQELLATGDPAHASIKTAAVFEGGGMRGVYGSGVIVALERLGMNEVFDELIGISAGVCNAAYLAAHQAAVGPSVFYDDLPKGRFISVRRPGNFMNMALLADVFRNQRPLDQQALRASRSQLHIGMTDVESVKARYLNLKDMPEEFDVVNALIASSALPGYTKTVVEIEGRRYSDGITTCNDPIGYAINELGATDILVVMNIPLDNGTRLTRFEKARNSILLKDFSQDFVQAHQKRHSLNGLVANWKYPENITIGVLCPERTMVSRASMNSKLLKKVADIATLQTMRVFGS